MEKICGEIKQLKGVARETVDLAIEFLTRLNPVPLPHCKGSSFGVVILQWSNGKLGCQISSADNLPSIGVSTSLSDFHSYDFETEEEKTRVIEDITIKLKHLRDDETKQEVTKEHKAHNENLATELLDLLRASPTVCALFGPERPSPERTTGIYGTVRLGWSNGDAKVLCFVDSEEGLPTAVEVARIIPNQNTTFVTCAFDTTENKRKTTDTLANTLGELFKQ